MSVIAPSTQPQHTNTTVQHRSLHRPHIHTTQTPPCNVCHCTCHTSTPHKHHRAMSVTAPSTHPHHTDTTVQRLSLHLPHIHTKQTPPCNVCHCTCHTSTTHKHHRATSVSAPSTHPHHTNITVQCLSLHLEWLQRYSSSSSRVYSILWS